LTSILRTKKCSKCGKSYNEYVFEKHHDRTYFWGESIHVLEICSNCHSVETEAQRQRIRLMRGIASPIRLGDKCQICGWGGREVWVGDKLPGVWSFEQTVIHHIIPISEGGAAESWNELILCPNCHKIIHRDPIVKRGVKLLAETHRKRRDLQLS
jgi:5-methylcytosine-specific restriction endonuclease McrA